MANSLRKSDHRKNSRQAAAGKLRVLWQDADGLEHVCTAELVDTSGNGIRIRVDIQMAPRTYVTVNDRAAGIMGCGSVRYCRFEKGKYAVGVEFSGGVSWRS